MTVPVVGSGNTWKTGRRCMPEIPATRLSVSGSLRPKLGLLLLLVVLVVALVLVAVPVVTTLLSSPATPTLPRPLHLAMLDHMKTTDNNLVFSPSLLQETLSTLARWSGGGTREQLCSRINCSASESSPHHQAAYLLPGQGTYSKEGQEWAKGEQVQRLEWRVGKARDQVMAWLKENGGAGETGSKVTEELDITQVSVVGRVGLEEGLEASCVGRVRRPFPGLKDTEYALVEGDLPLVRLSQSSVVRLVLKTEGLSLDLVLHTGEGKQDIGELLTEFKDKQFVRTKARIEFPLFSAINEHQLEKGLLELGLDRVFSQEADLSSLVTREGGVKVDRLYQGASLKLQCPPRNSSTTSNSSGGAWKGETLVFDRPFLFVLHDQAVALPLLVGIINVPNGDPDHQPGA